MRRFGTKRLILLLCAALLIMLICIVITSFVYSADLGYLAGDVFNNVDIPVDSLYINMFEASVVNWEIAYWSAMICEYTYEKPFYPLDNLALTKLGFTTARKNSFYDLNGESEDDLMVDVGVKDVYSDDGRTFTLVVVAFRGVVPNVLNDPTTKENMRRCMNNASKPWREIDASVHEGFFSQYNDILAEILPEVNAAFDMNIFHDTDNADRNIKFWITGHSMGGALSELFTLGLVESGIHPDDIISYGFASPLVGDKRLKKYAVSVGASERMYKIVHRQDIMGYIGYGLLSGKSLAADKNIIAFGSHGIFDRSHHSLPRIYLPFIASQNDHPKRQQFEASLFDKILSI